MVTSEGVVGVGNNSKLTTEGGPGLAGLTGVVSLAQKFGSIFRRCSIVYRAVRAARVVIVSERSGDTLRLNHAGEQLAVEAFVTETAVEAFIHAVLPWTGRLNEARRDPGVAQPRLEVLRNELTAVIAAQMARGTVHGDSRLERGHDLTAAHPATGHDVEVVVAVFIEERQELYRRTMLGGVEDDIEAPHVVDAIGFDLRLGPRRGLGPHGRAHDLQSSVAPHTLHSA